MTPEERKGIPVKRKYRINYNLINSRFGKLLVIKLCDDRYLTPSGKKRKVWECVCDCGNHSFVQTNNLCMNRTISCGCLKHTPEANLNRAKSRIKELSGLNEIIGSYKRNAKNRGYEFKLEYDDVRDITKRNCYYCNDTPQMLIKKSYIPYYYNGIDRIDNTKGYTLGNVVPCCGTCNKAKMDLSFDDFTKMITKIYKNLIE